MVRIRIEFNEDTPNNVKRDLALFFKSLKMTYNKDINIYTITSPNDMDNNIRIIEYIKLKHYINYISLWENYDSDKNEYDLEDYKYTFDDSFENFAKEDMRAKFIKAFAER